MPSLANLKEINAAVFVADMLGVSKWWLYRRRHIPIYAPNAAGRYPRRQVELIVDVVSGVYTADQAQLVLQAEHDAKRAQGAVAIANARKRRAGK